MKKLIAPVILSLATAGVVAPVAATTASAAPVVATASHTHPVHPAYVYNG